MVKVINITASQIVTPERSIASQIFSYWWIALIILLIIVGILLLVLYVVRKLKEKENTLILLSNERKKLCKQHRDKKRGKHFFRKSKNHPIICQYFDNGKMIRRPVGFYYGDFFSKEGNRVVRFAVRNTSKWFIFPKLALLLLNKNPSLKIIESYNRDTKKEKSVKVALPVNIDYWGDNEITLLGVKSIDKLDREGLFYVPIMADAKEGQLNPQSFAYEQIKQVIIGEQMIHNLDNFVTASKKALDLNTEIRAVQKINDSSSSTEQTK